MPKGPPGKRFYVYKFMDGDVCLYVGKGTGARLKAQERRFCRKGEIVKWFASEAAAYNHEAVLIRKLEPIENKVAGGGGAISRRIKSYRRSAEEIEMNKIGTRLFAGRALLRFDLTGFVSPDQIAKLKLAVAEMESRNHNGVVYA